MDVLGDVPHGRAASPSAVTRVCSSANSLNWRSSRANMSDVASRSDEKRAISPRSRAVSSWHCASAAALAAIPETVRRFGSAADGVVAQ